MQTITVQIGNSDDKLSQSTWSDFVALIHKTISDRAHVVYFSGTSPGDAKWQNYAIVFSIDDIEIPILRKKLTGIRENYLQHSIAWTSGETEFI
jgi:hypothetical protein